MRKSIQFLEVFNKEQRRGGDEGPTDGSLDDPQFFGPIRSEVVEGFSITFADIHIQIMVGDDVNAITGDVGSA